MQYFYALFLRKQNGTIFECWIEKNKSLLFFLTSSGTKTGK